MTDRRTAIVTGGGSGIGRAVAQALAGSGGWNVAVAGRRLNPLEETAASAGGAIMPVVADITDPASVDALFDQVVDRFGRLDLLFNNAGVNKPAPLDELPVEDLRAVLDTNLWGSMLCARAAMRAADSAREVRTVVTLALDAASPEALAHLGQRAILFVHGTADEVAAPSTSVELHRLAREPKELRLIDGAGHCLDESPGTVHLLVRAWLERWLASDVIPIPILRNLG